MSIQSIGSRRPELETLQVHYVAPPEGHNFFASFTSEFLSKVTPVALAYHKMRINALDPTQQAAAKERLARAASADARERARASAATEKSRQFVQERIDKNNVEITKAESKLAEINAKAFTELQAMEPKGLKTEQQRAVSDAINLHIGSLGRNSMRTGAISVAVNNAIKALVGIPGIQENQLPALFGQLDAALEAKVVSHFGPTNQQAIAEMVGAGRAQMIGLKLLETQMPQFTEAANLQKRILELRAMDTRLNNELAQYTGQPVAEPEAATERQATPTAVAPTPDMEAFTEGILSRVPAANREQAREMIELIQNKMEPFGDEMVMAAVTNAFAESQLDPKVVNGQTPYDEAGYGEDLARAAPANAVGLFQVNSDGGFFKGRCYEDRIDPEKNIDMIIEKIRSPHGDNIRRLIQSGASAEELTRAFTTDIEAPEDRQQKAEERVPLLRQATGPGTPQTMEVRKDIPESDAPAPRAAPPTGSVRPRRYSDALVQRARTTAPVATQAAVDTGDLGAVGSTIPGFARPDRAGQKARAFGIDVQDPVAAKRLEELVEKRRLERMRRGGRLTRGDVLRAMQQVRDEGLVAPEPEAEEPLQGQLDKEIAQLIVGAEDSRAAKDQAAQEEQAAPQQATTPDEFVGPPMPDLQPDEFVGPPMPDLQPDEFVGPPMLDDLFGESPRDERTADGILEDDLGESPSFRVDPAYEREFPFEPVAEVIRKAEREARAGGRKAAETIRAAPGAIGEAVSAAGATLRDQPSQSSQEAYREAYRSGQQAREDALEAVPSIPIPEKAGPRRVRRPITIDQSRQMTADQLAAPAPPQAGPKIIDDIGEALSAFAGLPGDLSRELEAVLPTRQTPRRRPLTIDQSRQMTADQLASGLADSAVAPQLAQPMLAGGLTPNVAMPVQQIVPAMAEGLQELFGAAPEPEVPLAPLPPPPEPQPDMPPVALSTDELPTRYPFGVPPDMMDRTTLPRPILEEYNRLLRQTRPGEQAAPDIASRLPEGELEERYPTVSTLPPAAQQAAIRRAVALQTANPDLSPEQIAFLLQSEFGNF